MITIAPFRGTRADMFAIADMHLDIRRWQVATTGNVFGDGLYGSQTDLRNIQAHYLARGGNFWTATDTDTGDLVGFVGLRRYPPRQGEVKRFAVDPGRHGQGIGSALVAALVGWARDVGLERLTLATGKLERARGIYERAGFVVVGEDVEHDDWRMRMDLPVLVRV